MWCCEAWNQTLYENSFELTGIPGQLPVFADRSMESESLRICTHSGRVMVQMGAGPEGANVR